MKLYENVLEVKINLGYFIKYRDIRHDIIHRNGRKQKINDLDYNIIEISDIEKLIENAEQIKETIIREFQIDMYSSAWGQVIFNLVNESFLNINILDEVISSTERSFFNHIIDKKESFRENLIYPERKNKKANNKRF